MAILVQLNKISAVANNCYLQWLMQYTCSYNPTLPYNKTYDYKIYFKDEAFMFIIYCAIFRILLLNGISLYYSPLCFPASEKNPMKYSCVYPSI